METKINKYSENSQSESPEAKFSESKEYILHKISPKDDFEDIKYPERRFAKDEIKSEESEEKEDTPEEKYSRFDDSITSSFIPPFNNPVYPNSTQYTGYTSVIGKCCSHLTNNNHHKLFPNLFFY